MTILEITNLLLASGFSPVTPYVYQIMPGGLTLAPFWTGTFGAPDQSRNFTIVVRAFIRAFTVKYNEVDSFNDCVSQEGSFFWDDPEQRLYIHFEHDHEGWTDTYQYGTFSGLSDEGVVYIDDIEYSPLILSVPNVRQSEDIVNYKKLSFVRGSAKLNNRASKLEGEVRGQLDGFISSNNFGNDVFLYSLDNKKITFPNTAQRSDLTSLASFFIEDYDISLPEIDIRLQDPRKAQNIDVPRAFFNSTDYPDIGDIAGEVIPVMYGQVREAKALPTNGDTTSGDVDFRVSLLLTVIGTVQVDIDGIWTNVATSSVSLSTGEFVLSSANGRNTNGSIRDCRVLLPTGIAITYTADIIVDLNERYLGIEFLDSNYNTSEWNTEKVSLSSGGVIFDSVLKLFEAIRTIQNGSNIGFRYEINPEGLRTIRIDDPDRAVSGRVQPEDIQNRNIMPVKTNSKQVFSEITVKYNQSFNSGRFQSVSNNDFTDSVLQRYKSQDGLTVPTILNNSTDADERALNDATRFSIIPSVVSLSLMGGDFLSLRIFDILDLELTPDFADADNSVIIGREYYGFQKGKVVSINPSAKNNTNKVEFQLIN